MGQPPIQWSLTVPSRSCTPTARPPSTSTCSTWHRNASWPPCFSRPRTSASTMAAVPPRGLQRAPGLVPLAEHVHLEARPRGAKAQGGDQAQRGARQQVEEWA